jgi:hypothetical protein
MTFFSRMPLPSAIIDIDNPEPGDWPSLEGKVSAEQGNDILNTGRDWIVKMLADRRSAGWREFWQIGLSIAPIWRVSNAPWWRGPWNCVWIGISQVLILWWTYGKADLIVHDPTY